MEANEYLSWHYQRHVPFADLPHAPTKKIELPETTEEERARGQTEFVEQFVPRTQWPEPRPVQSQRYSALFQEIEDLRNARPTTAEDEEQVANHSAETRVEVLDSDMED